MAAQKKMKIEKISEDSAMLSKLQILGRIRNKNKLETSEQINTVQAINQQNANEKSIDCRLFRLRFLI